MLIFTSNLTPQINDETPVGVWAEPASLSGSRLPDTRRMRLLPSELTKKSTTFILRHNGNWIALRVRGMGTGGRVQKDANNRAR